MSYHVLPCLTISYHLLPSLTISYHLLPVRPNTTIRCPSPHNLIHGTRAGTSSRACAPLRTALHTASFPRRASRTIHAAHLTQSKPREEVPTRDSIPPFAPLRHGLRAESVPTMLPGPPHTNRRHRFRKRLPHTSQTYHTLRPLAPTAHFSIQVVTMPNTSYPSAATCSTTTTCPAHASPLSALRPTLHHHLQPSTTTSLQPKQAPQPPASLRLCVPAPLLLTHCYTSADARARSSTLAPKTPQRCAILPECQARRRALARRRWLVKE